MSMMPAVTKLDPFTKVTGLKTQHPKDLIGLPGVAPSLTWRSKSSNRAAAQVGYEVEVSSNESFEYILAKTGQVESSRSLAITAPGTNLTSREIRFYRVRIATQFGWTAWSETLSYEAGLLSGLEFTGDAIGDASGSGSASPILRKEFAAKGAPSRARLYVSSQGANEISINGLKVGNEFLSPGWTTYQERLNVSTFDVTHLITAGNNAIGATLADGWWRGRLGFLGENNTYGERISVIAQLEIHYPDGSKQTIVTDKSWKSSTGSILHADIYDGSEIDLTKAQPGWNKAGFDDSSWQPVVVHELNKSTLIPRISSPIRKIAEFPMKLVEKSDRVVLIGEQNISGWVRLTVDGKKGQRVVVRHAELITPDQELHTKPLRTAKATDTYTLGHDGRHVFEPEFTFHGFHFADVVTDAEVISAVGVAISSDSSSRSTFSSSDTRLNRLHQNVLWSARDNFVGLPTDCPQRDERLGWTGDAQAFAGTANTLFDAESFWSSWLVDVALDQDENGDVGAVVPDILKMGPKVGDWEVQGRAGWADAASIVPLSVYEHFGDTGILKQQLSSMRRWTDALNNRRNGADFLPTEFQFSDWCDPDAPSDRPWEAKVSSDFVANAFFANTLDIMIKVESLVGTPEGEAKYTKLRDELKSNLWLQMGEHAKTTTAGLSMALEFGIVPESERQAAADSLAKMVDHDRGKITTGFLGTPLILHAMSKNGHAREAYIMLMRREIRSWLYQVDQNATTIWERWDAIKADGSFHSGGMDTASDLQEDASMISYNHYAYGAVIDWVYRNVAGLVPVLDKPAYEKVVIAPKPAEGFTFTEASIDTRFGNLSIHWALQESGDLAIKLTVPFGSTAELNLPTTSTSKVFVDGLMSENGAQLTHGEYVIVVTNPEVINYK